MYKSKLQELCQRKGWPFPDYTTTKEGPNHNPCFKTTVLLNGISFDTPGACKHLKESQSEAARLAYLHFTDNNNNPISSSSSPSSFGSSANNLYNTPPTGVAMWQSFQQKLETPQGNVNSSGSYGVSIGAISGTSTLSNMTPTREVMLPNLQEKSQTPQVDGNTSGAIDTTRIDMQHVYKNQLQTYAQKRSLGLPEYACKREGPPHASRFSCKVTVAEETYESLEFFSTLKEAEHAAAKVALMSLLPCSVPEANLADNFVYKNLLQELAQREGFGLPTYSTNSCGVPHMPIFISTVELKGEIFQGEGAKTKKLAEKNAAKVAYIIIKERGISQSHEFIPATCQLQKGTSSSLKSTSTVDLQENVTPPVLNMNVLPQENKEQERGGDQEASKKMLVSTLQAKIPCVNPSSDTTRKRGASDSPYACLQDPSPSVPSSLEAEPTSCSMPSESISNLATDLKLEQPTGSNTLQCKKVCVLPRTLNMKLPDGVTVFSDEKWIAIETGPNETTN